MQKDWGGGGGAGPKGKHLSKNVLGRNRRPPRISLEAVGASKDNFGGIFSSSDFPRNPKIMTNDL